MRERFETEVLDDDSGSAYDASADARALRHVRVVLEDVKHQQLLPAGDELVATGEGSEGGA